VKTVQAEHRGLMVQYLGDGFGFSRNDPLTLALFPLWRGEDKRGLHWLGADGFGLAIGA
jgi:hypothetical protein